MGHSFFLTRCLQLQLAFVVGSRSEVVELQVSIWGLRSQRLNVGGVDADINLK